MFDDITTVRDRRYPLVDVGRGLVVGIVMFDIPGGWYPRPPGEDRYYEPRSLLLVEVFHVEDGLIRHIEATMRDVPLGSPTGWN